ncbi:hypothetical protein B0H11DRAFT_1846886 [Mycena galericulata]|nr:hypothetical protein B0H11DRAFT_1846886 [Mycena galericulata]
MHGKIRQTYHRLTNFKDVTPQLVKHDHRRTVATFIRDQIDALNEDPDESPGDLELSISSNVDIGSKLKPVSFSRLEEEMSSDPAFERFRVKFGDFLSDFLPAFGYNLPNRRRMRFDGGDMITPFQFLKVHYKSMGTWTSTADYLRCNPKFHGQPRYDYVLIKTAQQPIFAQMIYLFSCIDKLLRFHRVRAKPRKNSEFISVHSIIRGAVMVPDFDKAGEFHCL